ncbi:nSTAND1 domain-containing NTPase [Nocardia pseudovaccinii]|uniref:nSTAND1 domain-containing NTPase n=1 Tax=Nocardia pseudovaccinii TaxID=189540 RepID=UPI0007A49B2A|nr:TIR domain-containing protein [Nocardia pseudovaccinii]
MSRVFLSHSSRDDRAAIALKAWLTEADPGLVGEIFLDLDRQTGIPVGVRWKDALRRASDRCEAVICLVSDNWDASHECKVEYRHAEDLNKPIFAARLQPLTGRDITSEWQRCDLFGDGPKTEIAVDGASPPVQFSTDGLLRLRDGLRAAGIGADTFAWPPPEEPDRAPYRGWQPLEQVDAAVYFGRDTQIGRALNAIRGMRNSGDGRMFVILGPSGVGKSSFLRAGMLPRLHRDDRHFLPMGIVRPQRNALTGDSGFAHSIHDLRDSVGLHAPSLGAIKEGICDAARVRMWLTEAQQAAEDRIIDATDDVPPTLVLPIDQAEELFGVDAGEQAGAFLGVLADLLGADDALPMIAMATIRSDRYEPLQTAPQLAALEVRPFDDLKPMPQAQFKEVICGPARRAREAGSNLSFAPDLVDRLLDDWSRGVDTLPLLSLTLARLYQDYGDAEITLAEYGAMGGLSRVVQCEIDEILAVDSQVRQRQLAVLRTAFVPWLATINPDNDQPMRRAARWFDLPSESHPLLEAFIARRLLARDERDGEVVVEVTLESLLRQWDTLAGWLREQATDLKGADELERAAHAWKANARSDEWLLPGSRLADAESLSAEPGFRERLNPTREFLLASRRREDERVEADLRAARERQESAEALAAAETQAKEKAQEYTRVLRRRSRILRVALALAVVAALAAGFLFVEASKAEKEATARSRDATALALIANSQLMLSDSYPGVNDDVLAMQNVLAARSFPNRNNGDLPLLSAVNQLRNLRKIIPTRGGYVRSLDFSPDGTRIVSSHGESIQLWDAETWKPIGEFMTGHKLEVSQVAFSPDGKRIVTAGFDKTLRLWDAESRQPIGEPMAGHESQVTGVAFSRDGRRIVSGGSDKTLRVWDTESRQPIGEPMRGHEKQVTGVAVGIDDMVASASLDGTVRLWDIESHQQIGELLRVPGVTLSSVAFSQDGTRIAAGGSDTTIWLWDAHTRQQIGDPLRGHEAAIERVVFSRDGSRLASASDDKTVRLWDTATGQPVGEPLVGHKFAVSAVAFHPDGQRLVSSGFDDTLREWDPVGGQVLRGHGGGVLAAGFSPDGTRIVSSGVDATVRQWDSRTGASLAPVIRTEEAPGWYLRPDGTQIITITSTTLQHWDVASGAPSGNSIAIPADTKRLTADVANRKLATDNGTETQIRDIDTMQPIGVPIRQPALNAFKFSPDGRQLATGGLDWSVHLWDTSSGQQIGKVLRGQGWVNDIEFSRDGRTLAVAYQDKTVRLWNAQTGDPIGDPMRTDGWVNDLAFSSDGRTIATGGGDSTVRLWDVQERRQIGSALVGHTRPVTHVEFSPDGKNVVSTSYDGTIRVWPIPTASTEILCDKMTYNMSRETWNSWVSPKIAYHKLCPNLPISGEEGK